VIDATIHGVKGDTASKFLTTKTAWTSGSNIIRVKGDTASKFLTTPSLSKGGTRYPILLLR